MRELKALLDGLDYASGQPVSGITVNKITDDSRSARRDDLFIAVRGAKHDGHDHAREVLRKGVAAVVAERDIPREGAVLIRVKDTRAALSGIASNYYECPSRKMDVIGVTGTNGKTTVSYLAEGILKSAGYKTGIIGTIKYATGLEEAEAVNTTPSPIVLQGLLSSMVCNGVDHCVMEVSSHALDQGRAGGTELRCAVFTNVTREHLDYHGTFDRYLESKAAIFGLLAPDGTAVINADDPNAGKMRKAARCGRLLTYGLSHGSDVHADDISLGMGRASYRMRTPLGSVEIKTGLIGLHNIYNAMAAACACISGGVGLDDLKTGIETADTVPGRLERVDGVDGPAVFIDYAHTDDALEKILSAFSPIKRAGVITVFGCGGDRDRAKRSRMGAVASRLSDMVFITSDNPRGEDPSAIISEIVEGMDMSKKNYCVIEDRETAIREAIMSARADDIVVIAGKGHEKYQLLGGGKISFDDADIARRALCVRSSLGRMR